VTDLTPDEVEVGRRNLIAELKGAPGDVNDDVRLDRQTVRDLLAVLEASKPEPPRKAFDVGYNIVNQLADLWEVPVDVRQATNDRCWEFASKLVASAAPDVEALKPVVVDREALRSHDMVGIPVDTNCLARHPVSGALCIESPGHESEHRAMGVSRLQWFGANLRESDPGADVELPHLVTTNNTGYFWCSCTPNHARVFRGLREHIAEITSPAVLAALYPKATEPVCTCTVTPTMRTLDRECPVHWTPIPKEGES
jgi:hypothetical protein